MTRKADAWMPFYIADYLRKTMHLTRDQHGAYLLLLMACWDRGGRLPNDPAQLAGIARATPAEWKRLASVMLPYFEVDGEFLTQRRVVEEREKAQRLSDARREAGKQGGRPRKEADHETKSESEPKPIAFQSGTQTETPTRVASPSPPPDGGLEDASASLSLGLEGDEPKEPKYPAEFEAVWRAYPHFKGRSSKKSTFGIWRRLPLPRRQALPSAIARYAREGHEPKAECGAPAMERWLSRELDLNWQGPGSAAPAPSQTATFPGPPDLRAAVVACSTAGEPLARGYLDRCAWRDVPERAVIAPNQFIADRIERDAGRVFRDRSIRILVAEQPQGRTA